MGGELYTAEPVFRAAVDRCDALWPVMRRCAGYAATAPPMPDPADAQPAGLALQVALTELWRSRGVVPGAVVGHSFGEVAAAWTAGALRSSRRSSSPAPLAAGADAVRARRRCRRGLRRARAALPPGVSVAAFNGPPPSRSPAIVEAIVAVGGKRLTVSIAYHSAQADALRDAFAAAGRSHPRPRAAAPALLDRGRRARDRRRPLVAQPARADALRRGALNGWRATATRRSSSSGRIPPLAALVLDAVPGAVVTASMRRRRPQAPFFAAAEAKLLGTTRREPVALADAL